MVTGSLKSYTDENIIQLIESLKAKTISYNLNDLKAVLAEVNTRHLDGNYAAELGELIRDKIINGDREEPLAAPAAEAEQDTKAAAEAEVFVEETEERPAKKSKKEKIKSIQQQAIERADEAESDDAERFPVLTFMCGFMKVIGWLSLSIAVLFGLYESVTKYLSNIRFAIGSIFSGLIIGTVLLLLCYSKAESILLKLETEKHLRKMSGDE